MGKTVSYYFNSKSSDWEFNPENMIDGSISTHADSDTENEVQMLDGNTCDGTDLGIIEKVEYRLYSGHEYQFPYPKPACKPYFNGTDPGTETEKIYAGVPPGPWWSAYTDITDDTNAPGYGLWSWDDVKNLDMRVRAEDTNNTYRVYVYKVEIRVTYRYNEKKKPIIIH